MAGLSEVYIEATRCRVYDTCSKYLQTRRGQILEGQKRQNTDRNWSRYLRQFVFEGLLRLKKYHVLHRSRIGREREDYSISGISEILYVKYFVEQPPENVSQKDETIKGRKRAVCV